MQFRQSGDLSSSRSPAIVAFRKFMATEVREWVSDVANLRLNESPVDLFCARYEYTDYLSCHDDKLEGRKIAFIW